MPPLGYKFHAHLILNVDLGQRLAKVLVGNAGGGAVLVKLGYCSLGNGVHLLLRQVGAHEQAQYGQELVLADALVLVAIVHVEHKAQLVLARVRSDVVRRAVLAAERRQHVGELTKVESTVRAVVADEHFDDAIAQRTHAQLRYLHERVLSQIARLVLVQ